MAAGAGHTCGSAQGSRVGALEAPHVQGHGRALARRIVIVTAKVRAATPEDERKLLSSFLGFVDRHSGDRVDTITIRYR